jgi:Ala-tRNA(Pro) deacylase
MKTPKKTINFLDKQKVDYQILEHRKVYTAIDKARTLKLKNNLIGKTVILTADRKQYLFLMAGDKAVDLQKVKKILFQKEKKKIKKISFTKEKWIKDNLKGSKIGSIPPFGSWWKIPTIVDSSFLSNKKIILNSGNHYCSIESTPSSFRKTLPDLISGDFGKKKKIKKGA